MESFLGVPIMIRGEAWGNLYLTDKRGRFTEARRGRQRWSSPTGPRIAIENARLYHEPASSGARELERAVRGLQATRDIAVAIGATRCWTGCSS